MRNPLLRETLVECFEEEHEALTRTLRSLAKTEMLYAFLMSLPSKRGMHRGHASDKHAVVGRPLFRLRLEFPASFHKLVDGDPTYKRRRMWILWTILALLLQPTRGEKRDMVRSSACSHDIDEKLTKILRLRRARTSEAMHNRPVLVSRNSSLRNLRSKPLARCG